MQLPDKYSSCVWCKREFALIGFLEENNRKLQRVQRSKEHIIPQSLFGRITSTDVCKDCNSKFGDGVDPALLRDGSILAAADQAGIKLPTFVASFEGYHHTKSGEQIKTKVKRGDFHPSPTFHPEGFKIAMTNGRIRNHDLISAKAKMLAVVKAKGAVGLSDAEIQNEIEELFREVEEKQGQTVFNSRIGQGLRSELLGQQVQVSWTYHPWETQWAVAKMFFEFSKFLWPYEYLRYCSPILEVFHTFIRERKLGIGILEHTTLDANPARAHEFRCKLSPHRLVWSATFFGAGFWSYSTSFKRTPNAPKKSYEIQVANPLPGEDKLLPSVTMQTFEEANGSKKSATLSGLE